MKVKKNKKRFPDLKTSATVDYTSFVRANQNYFGSEENESQLFSLGLGAKGKMSALDVDAHYLFSPAEEQSYFKLIEFKREYLEENKKITVGRHLHEWSKADNFWHLGDWHSRFLWDKFNPEEMGMTGVFYERKWSAFKLNLFGSFLFLPDQEPSYFEDGNRVRSKNPWFRSLPPSAQVLGQYLAVSSAIVRPDVEDVIFQPSAAFQVSYNWSQKWNTQLAYSYKPESQSLATFDYYLQSVPSSSDIAVVTIFPKFPYHHVATLEGSYHSDRWEVVQSVTHQKPVLDSEPVDFISQNKTPLTAGSIILGYHLGQRGFVTDKIYGGILRVWEEWPRDRGEDASENSQFDRRSLFYSALRAGAQKSWIYRGRPLDTQIEGTYDALIGGALLTTKARYQIDRDKSLGFRLNLIGIVHDTDIEYEKTFVRNFRANDNVGVDFSYAF